MQKLIPPYLIRGKPLYPNTGPRRRVPQTQQHRCNSHRQPSAQEIRSVVLYRLGKFLTLVPTPRDLDFQSSPQIISVCLKCILQHRNSPSSFNQHFVNANKGRSKGVVDCWHADLYVGVIHSLWGYLLTIHFSKYGKDTTCIEYSRWMDHDGKLQRSKFKIFPTRPLLSVIAIFRKKVKQQKLYQRERRVTRPYLTLNFMFSLELPHKEF